MIYRFDQFELDTDRFELRGPEGAIDAEPRALEFLIHLIGRRGQLVSKDEIHTVFWSDRVVSDAALSTLVSNARRLIGDSGSEQKYIETRHGRGFRFRGEVAEIPAPGSEPPAPPPGQVSEMPRVAGAPAIAVFPFDVVSESGDADILAESITEEIISSLARCRWFPLVARNRVRAFLQMPAEARSPSRDLGATYLIEGGIIRDADNVRVHLQLTDTATGRHIHVQRHDLRYEGLFALLDQVSGLVGGTIQPEIVEAERLKSENMDPDARNGWENFVLAQQLVAAPDKIGNEKARALLELANRQEPQSGRIRAGLAMTHLWDYKYDWSDNAELSLGAAARDAERALQLAPDDSWAWSILAICKLTLRRFDEALADARRAIKVDPASAMAHGSLSWVLAYSGHYQEAVTAYGKAVEINPTDRRRSLWLTGLGIAQFGLGNYEESLAAAHLLIALSPEHPSGHRMLAASLAGLGRLGEAAEAAAHLMRLLPHHDVDDVISRQPFRAGLGKAYADALKRAGLTGSGSDPATRDTASTGRADPLAGPFEEAMTRDGMRIAWARNGSGPPLVTASRWIGHIGLDARSPLWGRSLEALSSRNTLVRFDHRGMGLSQRDAGDFMLADLATDLEAVVDAAGLDRFPVFAMAQGCPVALEFMRRNPGRVTRLVLYGAFATGWRRPEWGDTSERIEAVAAVARLGWEEDEPSFRRVFTKAVIADATPPQLAWFDEYVRRTISSANAVRLLEALADFDLSDMLAEIDIPVLMLHARGDMSVPIEHGRRIAERIPHARFVEVESRNHVLVDFDACWAPTIDRITAFLRAG